MDSGELLRVCKSPVAEGLGRSAGSVLRALRKLGRGGAFALRAGVFGDRFQGSLRTDPAPLGVWALRGNGPALAGNVGAGWAFALSREGDQGVDVPRLAPARSRCRFVDWGPVPLWDGLMVAIEEKQSSLIRCVVGLAPGACGRWGLRGIGPALAGNVGASWAFALSREGDQDVDVPRLAPARSRCRFVDWGPVPLWDGLMVAVEEKQSSLTRCVVVRALGTRRRWGLCAGGAFGVTQRGTVNQPGVKPRV